MPHRDGRHLVFISHAGEQKRNVVDVLHTILRSKGLDEGVVFLDEDSLQLGQAAWPEMVAALHEVPVVVAVISPEYLWKKYPMAELAIALDRHLEDPEFRLIPILLDVTIQQLGNLESFYRRRPQACRRILADETRLRRYIELGEELVRVVCSRGDQENGRLGQRLERVAESVIITLEEMESTLSHAMLEAAKAGDVPGVKRLLRNGADINFLSPKGTSILHIAVRRQNSPLVRMVLQHPDFVAHNARAKGGNSALHLACKAGSVHVLQLLMESHLAYNRNEAGETPLCAAAKEGHFATMEYLLKKNVRLDDKSIEEALEHEDPEMTILLLENGFKPTGQDLRAASARGSARVVQVLLEYDPSIVNRKTKEGRQVTALHVAAEKGHLTTVQVLLHFDAKIDIRAGNGDTALDMACKNGCGNVAVHLAEAGAKLSTEQLIHLCKHNALNGVEQLLTRGVSPNSSKVDGLTALHTAVKHGHKDTTKLLLNHGADTCAYSSDGYTALHIASMKGHKDTTKLLLDHGAATCAYSSEGYTALHIAAMNGHSALATLLLQCGAPINAAARDSLLSPLHMAAQACHIQVLEVLLGCGADVACKCANGDTALHMLVSRVDQSQANQNWVYRMFSSLYKCLTSDSESDAVNLLLKHGARVDAENDAGISPLHLAKQGKLRNILLQSLPLL